MFKKFIFLLTTFLITTKAIAGISIFPRAIDFNDNDKKRSQTVTVINDSDKKQTYRVYIEDNTQDENGNYLKAEHVDNSAQKFLIYSPKQFSLMPHQSQSIRIAHKGMSSAKDGEYVSHLAVEELYVPQTAKKKEPSQKPKENGETVSEEKQISIEVGILFATSIPVTIYKGENLYQQTDIISAKQNANKLDLVLERKGNISSRFNLKVLDENGIGIGQAGPIRIYTPSGKRNLSLKLKEGSRASKLEIYDVLSKQKLMEKDI